MKIAFIKFDDQGFKIVMAMAEEEKVPMFIFSALFQLLKYFWY